MGINAWAFCAIVAATQGLFFALVLFLKQENRLANRLLGTMLLLLALTLTEWALWWSELIEQVPALMALSFGFPLLYGPLMFLFYRAVFEQKKLNAKVPLHFLPFLLSVFFMLPFYLRFFESYATALDWIPPITRQSWFPIPIFIQMIGYGVWVGLHFKKYFLENEVIRGWHKLLLAAYWGIVLTYLLYRLLPYLGLTAPAWQYLIAASLSIFIYLAAWMGYIVPQMFAGMSLREALKPEKYRKSALKAEAAAALFRRIADMMEQEFLYRKSDLSLDFLAEKTGEPRHHVSQAINSASSQRFSEFINSYRIQEACQHLSQTTKQELNIIEVAYAVGFKTKNAFNLEFKKFTGLTPTAFRQGQHKKA